MTVSEYSELKQQVVVNVGASKRHGQILHALKEFYKDDIDSARRFEHITKIGHLLNLLEIRDVLSEDDIGPLKEIARRLPNCNDLLRKLHEYEAVNARKENINYFASEVSQNSSNKHEEVLNNLLFGNISNIKRQRIINTVIEEIGSNWRDLARNLEIREGKIDAIEINNNNLESKATELMEEYKKIADPQRSFFTLCNALENIRRKDLSRSLQNIMTMNI